MTTFPSRLIGALVVSALVLTGCASDDGTDDGSGASGSDSATATESSEATGTEATGTEAAETAAPASETETDAVETEVTVVHAQGETTVAVDPEVVVTYDLGALDTLHELGVEVAGVPEVPSLPERLSQYASDDYAKVGSLFEPDLEQVNALEPDLIIVAARSSEAYPQLAEIAPTIDLTVDNADFADSFVETTETLGTIFGLEDEVDAQLGALQERLTTVSAAAAEAGTGLILLTSAGEVSAYGPGSRFGMIHDVLGVEPAVADVEAATHGDAVSFEFVLDANPDHLFVLDRDATVGEDGEAAEVILDNELVAQTTAWQEGNVTYLDGANWYLVMSGLGAVNGMLDDVEGAVS